MPKYYFKRSSRIQVFDKVKYFTDNIPRDDIAQGLTTWLNTAIENIQWEENGQKLNEFVTKFLSVFHYVAENMNWEVLVVELVNLSVLLIGLHI